MKLVKIDYSVEKSVQLTTIEENLTSNQGILLLEAYLNCFETILITFSLFSDNWQSNPRELEDLSNNDKYASEISSGGRE